MNEEDIKQRSEYLSQLLVSPGGKILFSHIDEEIRDGWEDFIALPVEKKTSKAAYDHQAKYKVLKGIKDWIESEIKRGE